MPDPQEIKDVVKVQQPTLAVETEHVDVIQAKPAEDVLRVKQPTTAREDAHILQAASSQRINSVWEFMQAALAGIVVTTGMGVCSVLALRQGEKDQAVSLAAIVFITGAGNLIIGFYFGRTNHTKSSYGGGPSSEKER